MRKQLILSEKWQKPKCLTCKGSGYTYYDDDFCKDCYDDPGHRPAGEAKKIVTNGKCFQCHGTGQIADDFHDDDDDD